MLRIWRQTIPKGWIEMNRDFDPWSGQRLRRDSRILLAAPLPRVSSRPSPALYDRVTAGASSTFFSLASFFPHPPVSCCPTGATNSWAPRSDQPWPSTGPHRIRYKNEAAMRATRRGANASRRDRKDDERWMTRSLSRIYAFLSVPDRS